MEGTLRVQRNSRGSAVEVRADADGIISHAGVGLLVELADRLGVTSALDWRAGVVGAAVTLTLGCCGIWP